MYFTFYYLPWFRLLYWGDGGVPGVPAKIAAVGMDGSNPRVLFSIGIRSPSYMTIDTDSQSLFFTDTFHRKVSLGAYYYYYYYYHQ